MKVKLINNVWQPIAESNDGPIVPLFTAYEIIGYTGYYSGGVSRIELNKQPCNKNCNHEIRNTKN
jgi:hypothetical protein